MLALALSACASQRGPEPIPAVPTQLVCPVPATPPPELIKRPRIIDFLPPEATSTSTPD